MKNKNNSHQDAFPFGEDWRYRVEVANTLSKRKEAYRLIYNLYRKPEVSFADLDSSEMWYSLYDAHPNTCTIMVRDTHNGKIVGALTIVIDSKLGLPMKDSYPDQLNEMRRNHKKCAEISSFGIHENYIGVQEILIQLMKFSYLYARGVKGVSDYLIMICPKHAYFYEKVLLYRPIGEEIPCSKVKNKTVRLYNLNLDFAEEEVLKSRELRIKICSIFNYFNTVSESQEIVNSLKNEHANLNKRELIYFFQEEKSLFKHSNAEQIQCLIEDYDNINIKNYLRNIYSEKTALISEKTA